MAISSATTTLKENVKHIAEQFEKELFLDPNYTLVLAIDFGTAFSGYAFSTKSDPEDVKVNSNWGTSVGIESYKTPTCILFDGDKKFISFGYQAQKDYAELEDGLDQVYYMFDCFKMDLHGKRNITKDEVLFASNGKPMPAMDVFAEALQFLRDHFIKFTKDTNINVDEDSIRWVITVPAIWSYRAVALMREAALKAHLIDDKYSKKLIIALEPESGSLYCRNLDINQYSEVCRKGEMTLKKGTAYVVLDAGGGTLDISIHKVIDDNRAEELHTSTGGTYGGSYVDKKFWNRMEEILTKEFFDYFVKKYPSLWLTMKIDFEQQKRACRSVNRNSTQLSLLYQLGAAYDEYPRSNGTIEDAFKNQKFQGARVSNGMIVIKPWLMELCFKEVIHGNISHLEHLLEDLEEMDGKDFAKPTYIFMVGGFSDSHLLQAAVIDTFGIGTSWNMQVIIPQEASLAVVKGAVRIGHNPSLITERKSMFCFGIKVRHAFDKRIHDKKNRKEGQDYVYIFDVKVKRNAPLNTTGLGTYSPTTENQSVADIELYLSDNSDSDRIRYVDDPDVDHLCRIKADWPGKGLNRTIEITLEHDRTELRVTYKTQSDHVGKEAIVDFFNI